MTDLTNDGFDDFHDDATDAEKDAVDGTGNALDKGKESADHVGKGKQHLDKAKQDAEDDDQETQDKAKNAKGVGDALGEGGEALEALGIKDPGLADLGDDISNFGEDIFGREPPEELPPIVYRVFFGKASTEEGLENMGKDALGGLMGAADSIIESVLPFVGDDPVSSFSDQDTTEDLDDSMWKIARFWFSEGLDEPFRLEMILRAQETRNPDPAAEHPANPGGGPLEAMKAPVDAVMGLVDGVADAVGGAIDTITGAIDDPMGALGGMAEDMLGIGGGAAEKPAPTAPFINIPIDPGTFLGQTTSVSFTREIGGGDYYPFIKRWVTGVLTEFEDLGVFRGPRAEEMMPPMPPPDPPEVYMRYVRVVVRPSFAKLGLRKNCRVFQEKHALEIIRDVFQEAGIYGLLPASSMPVVGDAMGAATDFVGDLVGNIPVVGAVASNALSGQFIKMIPPVGVSEDDWTPVREMCVQYNETDLEFVERLLQEEGISYFFIHEKQVERITFVHDPTALDEIQTIDGRPVPFHRPEDTSVPNVEHFRKLRQKTKLQPTTVTLRDFCFSDTNLAPFDLPAEVEPQKWQTDADQHEYYEYPAGCFFQYIDDDAIHYRKYEASSGKGKPGKDRDLAQLRLDTFASSRCMGIAESDLAGAMPGRTIKLRGIRFSQTGEDYNTDAAVLVVRRIRWLGGQGATSDLYSGPRAPEFPEKSPPAIRNSVEFHWVDRKKPETTPYRPQRTRKKPMITSLHLATVVDDDGSDDEDEDIFIDHSTLCRVRVRFHWDRRGEMPMGLDLPLVDLGTTCWVRVAQAWAGNDWGTLFVPRIGTQVVVAFENGDPDRPVIVGNVYDGEHPVPEASPNRSTIHTRSCPYDDDDAVHTMVSFHDETNKELVEIKAGRYFVEEVRKDHETIVKRDQKNDVKRHHSEIVEGYQVTTVEQGKRTKTVSGTESLKVGGHRAQRIVKDETCSISMLRNDEVKCRETIIVKDSRSLTIHGSRNTKIGELGKEPANDLHTVETTKKDTIKEKLEGRATALAIGCDSGDGLSPGGVGMESGADGVPPALNLASETGVVIEAAKEVTIASNQENVAIRAIEELTVTHAEHVLAMRAAPNGGPSSIELNSPKHIAIHTNKAVVLIDPGDVRLKALGSPEATMLIGNRLIQLDGHSFAMIMKSSINLKAGSKIEFK